MAVPDTNTFNLITVTDELGLGSGDSLQDCFNDSSAGDFIESFNPNAWGLNNNLLNFRGYDGASSSLTGFVYTASNYPYEGSACSAIDPILLGGMTIGLHNGNSDNPAVGDQVYEYTTFPNTQPLTGGGQGKYWGSARNYTAQTFKANSSGVVTYVNPCTYTGCGILSLAETTTKPYNIAANNGTLTVDYDYLQGTLQYNLNGGSWITPTQTANSGSFTLTGFSSGSGIIYFRTFGAWPGCARQLNYTVENANFFVTPIDVYKNVDPYLSVIGTTGTISMQVYNVNNQRVIGPTSTNPVNVGGLAIGSYFIYVTQTNPSYTYPVKTFRVA